MKETGIRIGPATLKNGVVTVVKKFKTKHQKYKAKTKVRAKKGSP